MSSLPNGLTFQVILTPPTGGNVSALRQQIQAGLGNIQANVQLNNAATANKQLNAISASTKKSTKDTKNFGDAIGIAGRNFAAYTSAVAILGRISIALSRATRDAIKFEREFVKLAQVFDTNVKNLEGLSNKISQLSQEYGLSANVISKTSVVLAQSGLTARETQIALNSLAKTTLASTFDNIAQTAEGAVAIIAQFEEGVGSLESQLGAINAVSKKFAVESNDIIEAVRRGGGAFKAANGTFNEFIALFTAVRSTTRESAETISTGFRTIFARLQRPKVIDYFKELNIQLEDGQGNFVGAFEAVKRLSEGLDRAGIKAGQIKFAEVVEQLGGIRQVSRVIPLLGQFKKAEEARQVALAGGVSLDKDVAKAQETTAQAIERTRQNFAALIREISQTQSFKEIVKIALSMANAFLEIARTLKPLIPLIAVLGSIKLGGIFATAVKTGFTTPGLGTKRPFAKGGTVLGFNRGGSVPGTGNGDTVPAMLEPGEFVIRKSAVEAFGADKLADINKYAGGGPIKASKMKLKTPTIANHYDTGPEHDDEPNVIVNTLYNADNPKQGNLYSIFRKLAYRKFATAIKETDAVKGGGASFLKKINSLKYLGEPLNDYKDTSTRLSIFGRYGDYRSFKKIFAQNTPDQGQYLNKITGAIGEIFVKKKKLKGGKKLATKYGADFRLGNKSFAEVKTLQGSKTGTDDVEKLSSKASLAYGVEKTLANKTLKNNQKEEPTLKLDYYNFYKKFAKGGGVGTDTVPALLTPGEFVINKKSAEAYGYGNLKKINKYAKGGVVGVQKFADGGEVGGFDFITSAASEFGILLFSLKQISGSFKQFQDGLGKSNSVLKELIGIDQKSIAVRQKLFEAGLMLDINLREGAEKIDAFQTRIVDASQAAEVLQKEFEFIGADPSGEEGTSRRGQVLGEIAGEDQVSFAGSSGPKEEKLDSKTKELLRSYSNNAEVIRATTDLQRKFGKRVGNQIKATTASNAAIKVYLAEVKDSAEAIRKQNQSVDNLTQVYDQLVQNQRDLSESSKKRQKQLDAQTEASKGFRSVKGATRGVKKGLTSVASKIDPLVATAAIVGSLDSILNQIIGSFSDLAESAAQNGDVQEAALAARQESEAKLNKTIILGAAATGAAIGTIVPVVGTAIGAGVGAIAGTLATYTSSLKTSIYDGAISLANMTGFFGQMETYSEELAKNEKKRVEQAKTTNIQKALDGIGVQFRNASRDLDPKTNFAGFASEANKLAKATKAQKDAAIQLSKDAPNRAEIIAQSDQQVKDAFDQLAEAANAQGISLEKVAQDYPELVEAFKATLPPGEVESMWKQRIQASQASIAAIAAENAAKQRSISIFLAQLSIQVRLNASLEAFDAALSRQKDSLANLDFAISGSVGKKEIGSNLTDFDSSGTAKFAEGLREVSRLGPDFANQANQIQGVFGAFNGFAQSLAGGDLQKVSSDISTRLSGILSGAQIDKIREEVLKFEGKDDPAAVKALEKRLIEDAIGPFAETLERGRQQINESLDNYSELLEKRNTIEQRIYDRRVESLKLEQDIKNKIAEIRGDDPSLFQAGADRTARGRNALAGTGLGGSLTGNAATDVSLVANELAINKNAQKLLQQNINSGRLNLQQQKSARSALQDLGLEADKLENSMQLLSDTTQETAILQKKLDESREGRRQKGELATELAFGTKESRFNFQQTLGLTKLAVQSGSAEVIPEEKRADVLSLLKRFEKLPVFGGRTGAEVIKNLTGNFLRNQGFNESQIDEVLADMVPTEEKILKQIENNLTVDEIRNNLLRAIAKKLDADVLAANPKSTGGPIYASTGKLVNYQPKGTDTVPAMLTPGEFVIKKSSVDKYGAGMLSAINAGNYATGGAVKPKYLRTGGEASASNNLREQDKRLREEYNSWLLLRDSYNNFVKEHKAGRKDNAAIYESVGRRRESEHLERFGRIRSQEEFDKEFARINGAVYQDSSSTYSNRLAEQQQKASKLKEQKAAERAEEERQNTRLVIDNRRKPSGGIEAAKAAVLAEESKDKLTKEASSKRQKAAFDANLGIGPKPYAESYKKKMTAETAKPVTDGTNKAGTPADAEAPSTDIFRTILERGFGIGVEVKKTANETPEQKSETPQQRRERISKQIEDRKRRMDEAKAKKAEAFSGNNEPSISGSSNYPSNPEGIYHIKQAFNAPNLAKFLKSNLGSDALPYIKAYKDAGVNPTKISGSKLSIFKESEAQLILTGNPISDSLTLSGNFTKNPKLSVLSQDEKLFFLWAKNGKIKDVEDARDPKNISYFQKNLSKIRANFLDLGFQSNPPSLGKDHRDPVGYLNNGGPVGGVPGVDANPAMLTRGEYVINKKSAEAIGTNNLNRLNSIKGYNKGGRVGYYADGGSVGGLGNSSESYTMFSNSVDKLVGNNGFAMFKESVDQFNSIPKELTLTVAPTQVTVTLNGAELLSRMTPMIKSQIFEGITSEINKLKEDLKSGNIV